MRDFRNPHDKVLRDREECIECDLCVRQCANEVHYRDKKTGAPVSYTHLVAHAISRDDSVRRASGLVPTAQPTGLPSNRSTTGDRYTCLLYTSRTTS